MVVVMVETQSGVAHRKGKFGRVAFSSLLLVLLLFASFYLAMFWAFSRQSGEWKHAAPSPLPRFEGPAAVVGGKLFTFSGFFQATREDRTLHATKQVHVYDPSLDRWQRLSDMPIAVTHLNPAVDGQSIWFAGGFMGNNPGPAIRSVWKYDVVSDSWTEGPSLPEARGGGGLVQVSRTLHYVGGHYAANQEAAAADHWMLSLDSGTEWVRRAPLPVPRGHFGIVALNEKIYVLGGTLTHHPNFIDTDLVHVYDSKQDKWHAASSLPSARSHFEPGTFILDGRIYIVGGRDNQSKRLSESEMADITVYDPTKDAWSELRSLPYPLRAPVAQVIGESLIVTNGSTFMAEEPQTATLIAPCGAPGSICNPEGFEAFHLRSKGMLKAGFKSLAHHTPFRVQDLLGFSHFVGDPAERVR